MKIGILILAHSQPEQLKRLVGILKKDFEIFIHIDKRSEIPMDLFSKDNNVHLISQYPTYWGSLNFVLATVELLKRAYEEQCDYYLCISGSDIPIRKNEEIIAAIEKTKDANYMSYTPLPFKDWSLRGGLDRFQLYFENIKNPTKLSLFNWMCRAGRQVQKRICRRKLYPLPYYGGSNWFDLTKETVAYVLDFLRKNPNYIRSFRHTLSSDEVFFQTIVLNSPFSQQTINKTRRYIDWETGPERPRVLQEVDFEKIIVAPDVFFARKVTLDFFTQYERLCNTKRKDSSSI